jgi:hypothetical protein
MNNRLSLLAISSLSAVIGYYIGNRIARKKYEHLADREVESLKRFYESRKKIDCGIEKPLNAEQEETTAAVPVQTTDAEKYNSYGKPYRNDDVPERIAGTPNGPQILKKEEVDTTKPYVITPEEFRDSNYEARSLLFTHDKVLLDEDYNVIDNIGLVGGFPNLNQIGKYAKSLVHIRVEKDCIDYEVIADERTLKQVNSSLDD